MDYNINFPHLHIYLQHVIKSISIGSFDIAMYGIIIACGMLAGLGVACYVAKNQDKILIHTLIWHLWQSCAR